MYNTFMNGLGNNGVAVFLQNGVRLEGIVTAHCSDGFILTKDGVNQFVNRLAVATISPESKK